MDVLDRLYRRIVEALASVPREPRGVPVTVGEIYQTIVPYRAVRGDLRLAELAQYEHALLRLLSGERDYVFVEREDVREEVQRELRAPNPILGLYRDYADAVAFVNPHVFVVLRDAEPAPAAAAAAPQPGAEALARPASPPRRAAGAAPAPAPREEPAPEPPAPVRVPACPGCRSFLPTDREARFCPFCGKGLKPVPCAECSQMVEPEWSFCANCGWPRPQPGAAAAPLPERRLR